MKESINKEVICSNLAMEEMKSTLFVYDSVDSTNNVAKKMALQGKGHGTIVISEHQTAGRGQYGRAFYSPPGGGLYMSLIVEPDKLKLSDPTIITASVAVTLCEVINKYLNKKIGIKWVNDLYFNHLKVGGILTESFFLSNEKTPYCYIVGIGLNISTPVHQFPEDVRQLVTSLSVDEPLSISRNKLAAEVIQHILQPKSCANNLMIMKKYKDYSLILGKEVVVYQGERSFLATACDINQSGQLVIKTKEGKTSILTSGDVRIKPKGNHCI